MQSGFVRIARCGHPYVSKYVYIEMKMIADRRNRNFSFKVKNVRLIYGCKVNEKISKSGKYFGFFYNFAVYNLIYL